MKNDIIIYHRSCRDGFGAAAVAFHWYRNLKLHQSQGNIWRGSEKIGEDEWTDMPKFIGLDPSRLVDDLKRMIDRGIIEAGSRVRCFDVSFTPESYQILVLHCPDLVILDHHKTTWESFPPNQLPNEIICINSISGCVLAWWWYYGRGMGYMVGDPTMLPVVPEFLLYLQDRDLWVETQEDSKVINEGLYREVPIAFVDDDFRKPDFWVWLMAMGKDWEKIKKSAHETGRVFIRQKGIDLNLMKRNAKPMKFAGYQVLVCNTTSLISDLGNLLVTENPEIAFAVLYRIVGNEVWFSLRGRSADRAGGEGGVGIVVDVSEVSKNYGGGGHFSAAGFMCKFGQMNFVEIEGGGLELQIT